MIRIKEDQTFSDHHCCRVLYGLDGRKVSPLGTHYLFLVDAKINLRNGFESHRSGISVLSTAEPYTVEHQSPNAKSIAIEFASVHMDTAWTSIDSRAPGRLVYISGCSNSNLLAPSRNGDPCVNYLYFPPAINQDTHLHPTFRIGFIVHGQGKAEYIEDGSGTKELSLKEGDLFFLPRVVRHRFCTEKDSPMSLVVFHPDSESGPLDEANPMFSRTYRNRN